MPSPKIKWQFLSSKTNVSKFSNRQNLETLVLTRVDGSTSFSRMHHSRTHYSQHNNIPNALIPTFNNLNFTPKGCIRDHPGSRGFLILGRYPKSRSP